MALIDTLSSLDLDRLSEDEKRELRKVLEAHREDLQSWVEVLDEYIGKLAG